MTQTELFPMTQLDIAQAFLNHFEEEVEKRLKAVISANDKLLDAQKLRDMAEAELRRAQDHVPSGPIANAAEALKAAAQANGFGVTFASGSEEVVVCEPGASLTVDMDTGEVTQTPVDYWTCLVCRGSGRLLDETGHGPDCRACDGTGHQGPSCDNCTATSCNLKQMAGSPTMGCGGKTWLHGEMMGGPEVIEVAPQTIATTVERTCPECAGDGRLPDKTGGGHHRCRECDGTGKILVAKVTPFVLVAWPGVHDMQTVEVGPLTRFGELAADFLSSLPGDDPRRADDFTDYRIVDVDADSERDPHAVITASDHGLLFSVEAPVAEALP